jgi:hypothetical protein
MKLKNAAHTTAYCGFSTRVETTVAIELAASCSPFRKSNTSATVINAMSAGKPSIASIYRVRCNLDMLDDYCADLVSHILKSINYRFEMIVNFCANQECDGVSLM